MCKHVHHAADLTCSLSHFFPPPHGEHGRSAPLSIDLFKLYPFLPTTTDYVHASGRWIAFYHYRSLQPSGCRVSLPCLGSQLPPDALTLGEGSDRRDFSGFGSLVLRRVSLFGDRASDPSPMRLTAQGSVFPAPLVSLSLGVCTLGGFSFRGLWTPQPASS